MLGFLLALHLSLLSPNSSLFDFSSPLVSGDYASTLPISINLETQIKLFKLFYVGGGIDTIMHIDSLETPLAGTPTYEEYTFNAGTDFPILFQNLPFDIPFFIAYLNIGWVHECIHPVHPYSQAEWSLSQGGRYEGSYDLIFAKLHDEIQPVEFSLTQGYYLQHSFNDYMLGNDTAYWNSPLMFTGSNQRLQINIFFISLEEKIFFDKKTQIIQDDYFFTCQAEIGIDIYKHVVDNDELKGSPEMIVGIRFNNVDPLAPLLWAENINFTSPWYVSIFIDVKLEGNLL